MAQIDITTSDNHKASGWNMQSFESQEVNADLPHECLCNEGIAIENCTVFVA
jgi:hypothetical protein